MDILPALLVKDQETLVRRVQRLEAEAPVFHLDVMDGIFVPNRTWWDPVFLAQFQTPARFELHLMVERPEDAFAATRLDPKIVRYIWHLECEADHAQLLRDIHASSKEAGLAINPPTDEGKLDAFAADLDSILVMGAMPGFSGQEMDPDMIQRAARLAKRFPDLAVGFDIGVNTETIQSLKVAGVSRCCAASALFGAEYPSAALHELRKLAE
jgi:ribulose-phosphate 3-epimerase